MASVVNVHGARKRRNGLAVAIALICVSIAATACSSGSTSNGSSGTTASSAAGGSTPTGKTFTMGNAIGGPRNDQAYFQSVYEGARTAAKTYGVKLSVADSLEGDQAAAADAIRNLATGNKLVIA